MRALDTNPLAMAFASAAGLCFIAIEIAFQLMRKRANEQLPSERGISWFISGAMRKTVVANYRRFYSGGWEYRAYRTFGALWITFVILSILALFLGSAK
jgi:hypothetical protein